MRTLKQLIHQWLHTQEEANTARLRYFQQRHDTLLALTEWKLQAASLTTSNWPNEDKETISDFYQSKIDGLNSELWLMDVKWDLNIK